MRRRVPSKRRNRRERESEEVYRATVRMFGKINASSNVISVSCTIMFYIFTPAVAMRFTSTTTISCPPLLFDHPRYITHHASCAEVLHPCRRPNIQIVSDEI